jgi:hypothetical protein
MREAMLARVSTRTFDGSTLDSEERNTILGILEKALSIAAPFGTSIRLALAGGELGAGPPRMGTYGLISGAAVYVVAAAQRVPGAMEDLGYIVEGVVLELTALGYGTCWIGGIFDRGTAIEAIAARQNEIVPVVIAVGRVAEKRSFADRIVTRAAKSRSRKALEAIAFDSAGEGGSFDIPFQYSDCVEAVHIAPSASNKQPWRLVFNPKSTGEVLLCLAEDRIYNNSLGEAKLQNVDIGIAMRHFYEAAREQNLQGSWHPGQGLTQSPALNLALREGWKPMAIWA